jgi:hypothetical protein
VVDLGEPGWSDEDYFRIDIAEGIFDGYSNEGDVVGSIKIFNDWFLNVSLSLKGNPSNLTWNSLLTFELTTNITA